MPLPVSADYRLIERPKGPARTNTVHTGDIQSLYAQWAMHSLKHLKRWPKRLRHVQGILAWAVVALISVAVSAGMLPRESAGQPAWQVVTPGQRDSSVRPPPLSREFRGVWVASVVNIDWPSRRDLTVEQMQSEARALIATARRANLNAIVLQVRPSCDALYASELEPWSEFLTGQSGRAPPGGFDPLEFWVREAHEAGLELHAWVNPFRARHFGARQQDAPTHISRTRPDLVRAYDKLLWLDPGEPEAREHSLRVIMDIVRRYDLDGIHMDDYFYPYPKEGLPFPDDVPYERYRRDGGTLERSDWRRDNINQFVRSLYEQVKALKPHVKVGISPFGIWRPGFPPGIAGFDAYERLSADARLWLRNGWLDYCSPQLYWPMDQAAQSYVRLLDWWIANNDHQRHLWPGNFTSRILEADSPASSGATTNDATAAPGARPSWEPQEILRQIEATRRTALGPGGGGGNIHFSMVALAQNRRWITDALASGPYATPAVVPASPWLAGGAPVPPAPAVKIEDQSEGIRLSITHDPGVQVRLYAVWVRAAGTWTLHLIPAARAGPGPVVLSRGIGDAIPDAVVVSAIDRFGREGAMTTLVRRDPSAR
jgi:uncharacterized lipoprotein YddW (UPF0748 family)